MKARPHNRTVMWYYDHDIRAYPIVGMSQVFLRTYSNGGLAMDILAMDLGKNNTVICHYDAGSGKHKFAKIKTTPQQIHPW